MSEQRARKVIASVTVSLDGYTAGPGCDLTGMVEQAGSDETMTWFAGVYRGTSTAVMGRTNYEGLHGYWPAVARDPERRRAAATWPSGSDEVEKVVFSTGVPPRPLAPMKCGFAALGPALIPPDSPPVC